MMNKTFTDTDPKDSGVQMKKVTHQPNHLKELINQNQYTIQIMSVLMEQFAELATQIPEV